MAFIPVNYEEGKVQLMALANSVTTTKGGALKDNGSGYLTNAAADDNTDVLYVAAEVVTTTSAGELVACWPTKGVRFLADCEDAPAQTDVGTYCDLASATTLDPDSSTDDIFYIESINIADNAVGTSTQVYGYFQQGAPNA